MSVVNGARNRLPVKEVAKLLGVGVETVRRYIREDKLPAAKIRTRGLKESWGVLESDLRDFARSQNIELHQ